MSNKTYKYVVFSALSSCVAEIITFPICTIKTNYQNSDGISIYHTTKSMISKHGIQGLYNASGIAIVSQILSTTTKYTWYQTLKDIMPLTNTFVIGALSGILACIMTHPVDVVKIHHQMHTPFLSELKQYGPMLFYRGYSKTLIKSTIGSSCFFPLFDFFNQKTSNSGVAALYSSVISTIIMQPIDYMKTRHIYGQPFFTGWNPYPYFKGVSLNLSRVVPHFIITMTLIEWFKEKYINEA